MSEKAKKTEKTIESAKAKQSAKRVLRGVVVSDKMQDTVVVAVSRYVKHPKYKKYLKHVKKYHAHDKGNNFEIGDKVEIREAKPYSKMKRFEVIGKQ